MLALIQRPMLAVNALMVTFVLFAGAIAQQTSPADDANRHPGQPAQTSLPAVSFTLDWPGAQPPHYTLLMASDGGAEYASQPSSSNAVGAASDSLNPSSDPIDQEPFSAHFTISAPIRDRIFSLAKQADFFNGNFNYERHRVANTGSKTLAYTDSARHYQTSYNWSENKAVDELTHIFEGIGSTIESGRRLQHLMRFDKLGLNAELSGMEQAAQSGQLRELQIIAPVLQQIASNSGYMNIARERARHLLQLAAH